MSRISVRLAVTALLVAMCACAVSCTSYSLIAEGTDLTSHDLSKGTHVRIHFHDGAVARGTVVDVTEHALVCKTQTYPLDRIHYVEREGGTLPGYVLFLLGIPIIVALVVGLSGEELVSY